MVKDNRRGNIHVVNLELLYVLEFFHHLQYLLMHLPYDLRNQTELKQDVFNALRNTRDTFQVRA